MGRLSKWLHAISDDVLVYGATVVGVAGSIVWPWVLAAALQGKLPILGWTDLIRFGGAAIVGIVLSVRADRNMVNGDPSQRMTKAAIRRRMKAGVARGFAWQSGVKEFVTVVTAMVAGGGA